ncbi:uncharacterized protein LOC130641425 [Hydractinia symbiolongicarpus]|uniref:uncharacterized protein LOC130641425 n=1 Tax=Hydractinia symbiolongicarpus TaxID=13093 RepID=UPI002550B275|nr:uncharacterized protein LOC130641425 [Hydractinia symbiolongicarpus]
MRNMIFFYVTCFAILSWIASNTTALSCNPCLKLLSNGTLENIAKCRPAGECKGGLSKSVCGCCDVCAKVENEKCGGIFMIKGRCDKNLECKPVKETEKKNPFFNGICVPMLKPTLAATPSVNLKPHVVPTLLHIQKPDVPKHKKDLLQEERKILRKIINFKENPSLQKEAELFKHGIPRNHIDDAVVVDPADNVYY